MKLVIFDMDGLMFDSESVMLRAFLEMTEKMGLHATREQGITLIGKDSRDIWNLYRKYFGEDIDAQGLYRMIGGRIKEIIDSEGVAMKKGLVCLLDQLDQKGVRKVIASGSSRATILNNLRQHGLEKRFDGIISSEEVKKGKPEPDVFLACLDLMQVEAKDALVLEDSPLGVQASLRAEIPVIAVPDLLEISDDLRKQCLDVKNSLDEIEI